MTFDQWTALFAGIVGGALRGFNQNTIDAATLSAGFRLNTQWSAAYAYDIGLSPLRSVHNGSHEITLKYNLIQKNGGATLLKIIHNPRYF